MKTEDLKAQGLTEEQITYVMAENGRDIAREQGDKKTLEKELEDTKALLKDANKQIDSFKSMDIETIKKSAENYKTKYEEANKKSKEDIAELKKSHAIDLALLNTHHAKNVKSVRANLNLENIKLDGDKLIGFDDQIEALKKSDAYLFEIDKVENKGLEDDNPYKRKNEDGSYKDDDLDKLSDEEYFALQEKNNK